MLLPRSPRRARTFLAVCIAVPLSGLLLPALASANVAPTANGQAISVSFGSPAALTLSATDPDGPSPLAYAVATPPPHGALSGLNAATGAITYTPVAGYNGADSFTFTASDGAATSNVAPVQITVSPQPTVSLSATSLGFGEQPVGTMSSSQAVTLTNTSAVPATIASIAVSGDFTRNLTCLSTRDPGASCAIDVSFAPTAPGSRAGSLTITDNAAGSPQVVALGGTGTGASPYVVLMVATNGNGAVTLAPGGTPTGPAGATTYLLGSFVTLTAQANPGYLFIGWTFDGAFAGWANPRNITMNTNHAIGATIAVLPSFTDVPGGQSFSQPVAELSARGTVRGHGDGRCGPGDMTLRAQMAALIARASGWDGEDHGNAFPDRGVVDAELWRSVGTIACYGVAFGFGDGTFRPVDAVLYAQSISFISRAMVVKGYWARQPDKGSASKKDSRCLVYSGSAGRQTRAEAGEWS